MSFTDQQLLRWSRQIMLPEMDIAGQQALRDATVLVVGVGGLGCPAALYLAAAGVGRLLLADPDQVELSNLQRQILHRDANIGQAKTSSAAETLAGIAPDTQVEELQEQLQGASLDAAVARADVVLDGTDNISSRYAMNRACLRHKVPLVSAAAIRFDAQLAVFDPRQASSPCYRCLFPEGGDEELNCAENGVIAPLVGIVGSMEAMETIKLITGIGTNLVGSLLVFDALTMDFRKLRLPRNPQCPDCNPGNAGAPASDDGIQFDG